jgi:hypothetical protein
VDVLLYSGLNDRELNNSKHRSKHPNVELSYPLIRDQKSNESVFGGAAFPINGVSIYILTKQKVILIVNTGMTVTKKILKYRLCKLPYCNCYNPANKIARINDVGLF